MQTAKKIPLRKCLGCNEMKPKRELIRVVKSGESEFCVDTAGRKNGRGAYICPQKVCFDKAKRNRRFEKAFNSRIPEEIYNKLFEGLCNYEKR